MPPADNNHMGEELYLPPGSRAKCKSAFDWDIYKNRKSALQHLRKQSTLVDIILETEDGSSREPVHSQVISAFGDKLTKFIEKNSVEISSTQIDRRPCKPTDDSQGHSAPASAAHSVSVVIAAKVPPTADVIVPNLYKRQPSKMKLVRLPKVTKYTLNVLIECAYTGYVRTDLPSGGIWQVLEVADHYGMTEVIRACCNFLDKNLNQQNCVHFYHVGTKHKHTLQRNAWHQIRANFKYILEANLLRSSRDLLENGVLGPNWANIIEQRPQQAHGNTLASSNQSPNNIDNNLNQNAVAGGQPSAEDELRRNDLATIKYEHFEPLLLHDKLNIDQEESVWYAIKLWCNYNLLERSQFVPNLLTCMRFPRFRQGTDFSSRQIWRDPLIINNKEAQHQLALLDRNHRELLSSHGRAAPLYQRDGYNLPCAIEPRPLRPRIPHSILLAIGGWQQGQPTKLIESFDLNCNMWFESKRKILTQLAYHGIENINNLLYICGGTDGNEILNELFVFNPILGECQQKASMREPRCYVSTAHLGGFLYAMGGHNGVQRMRSVERFDLKNEHWLRCPDMNVARSDASACVYDSLIFVAGGLNDQVIESSVEFYNCQDQSWTFIQSMQTPRTSFTLLSYQCTLLAIGGNNGHERLNSVELYDFRTKQWSQHSQMRHRRSTFSAALLDESKLIVVGGYNGQTPFAQVEMFDLASSQRSWQMLQKIRYDRSGLKVVVVKDLPNAIDYSFLGAQQAAMLGGGPAIVSRAVARPLDAVSDHDDAAGQVDDNADTSVP